MSQLQQLVRESLDKSDLDADTKALVLAACAGVEPLAKVLDTGHLVATGVPAAGGSPLGGEAATLRSLTVEGFRGIGEPVTLSFTPGPGLMLVVGRNGSGKSSFAEALELLLTGDSRRWAKRSAIWKEGWQNLHAPGATSIRAVLDVTDAAGPLTIERSWKRGATLASGAATAQFKGRPARPAAELGWDEGLATFRPFLSYNELGSILDEGPTKLFDALAKVLGLDELVTVTDRLAKARRDGDDRAANLRAAGNMLALELDSMDDPRAAVAKAALTAKTPDYAAVAHLLRRDVAGPADDDLLGPLQSLSMLTAPAAGRIDDFVEGLVAAAANLEAVVGTDAGLAHDLAGLLRTALRHYQQHPSADCPVCGSENRLGDRWADESRRRIADLERQARVAEEAAANARDVQRGVLALLGPPPAIVGEVTGVGLDAQPLTAAWEAWADWHPPAGDPTPSSLRSLAEHLQRTGPPLEHALGRLTRLAGERLRHREDLWRLMAGKLAALVERAERHAPRADRAANLKPAETWVKALTVDVRNARFAPIAGAAKAYWELLRQQSNVELGSVSLSGSATARKVVLDVTVDGTKGAALGVMSQGELHALALSLFLPRATLDDSPFRFLVIDDPVQSMDPARVDGLARVLEQAATNRQVVVFTHDDRLPEAIRRLGISARVLEVTRRTNSRVELRAALDPVGRALNDAFALVKSTELPEQAVRRVVPGLCRLAIEARCSELVWRRRLARGVRHADIEAALAGAEKLNTKMALALFDDSRRGGDVMSRLNQRGRRGADAYKRANRGAHEADTGNLLDLVRDVEVLVGDLETVS